MKMMKKLFALLLVMCMVLSLCACGGNSETKDDDQKDKIENNQNDNDVDADVEDDKEDESENTAVSFKVTVVDESGNPVQGCVVQVCKDTCVPMVTDANGVAPFNVEITDGYKVQVSRCPDGYVYEDGDVYLEAGATEVTITLKAEQ